MKSCTNTAKTGSENEAWTYNHIKDACGDSHSTIADIAKRFVMEGWKQPLGRRCRKIATEVTGDVEGYAP